MIREHAQKSYPIIHAVHEVVPTPTPPIQVSYPGKSVSFNPTQARMRSRVSFVRISPSHMQVVRACQELPKHSPLELRQAEAQKTVASSKGPVTKGTTS